VAGIASAVAPIDPTTAVAFWGDVFDILPVEGLRVVALGYELGYALQGLPARMPPDGQPYGLVFELESGIVVDHVSRTYLAFGDNVPNTFDRHSRKSRNPDTLRSPVAWKPGLQCSYDPEHAKRISKTLEHIVEGNIYQANISRSLRLWLDPASLLTSLYRSNPVAHAAYVRGLGCEILSNSMETLLTFDPLNRKVASYPIKGTASRHPDRPNEEPNLQAQSKDFAEHVMIVDLVRNDLGKVSAPGTVRVEELMTVCGYDGVWHGVSCVSAQLQQRQRLSDLVAAVFPGGSITGAPKRRAMQIIDEIEGEARGFYTGSVALLAPSGRLSMSILIRTLVRAACEEQDHGAWSISVGGGIVAESQAQREIDETCEKLAFLSGCSVVEIS